ncbi:hypothetical protein H5410_056712 [Solanum commersonii]|uniref:Pentatricopeptide repeat-containing protein n=1 Tax=Solanum commersonii TaxID=4109 RepID=A0A9J5WM36_SOLCO|nr:hypothetical protein H5410_056712 [Solanum commersonii]
MPHEAIIFYSRLKHVGSSVYHQYTYSSIIKACVETKWIFVGNVVHCHILHSGIHPSRMVSNSLLNMYSATCLTLDNGSDCDLVDRVFRSMRKRNIIAWNTVFSLYVKRKRFSEAVRCFVMMMRLGIKPTVVSFTNCCHCDLCCIDLVTRIFESTYETNTEIWNPMISQYIQNNFPFKAVDLFLEAIEAEDVVTTNDLKFVSALMETSQLQYLEFAQQLHACLINKCRDS